MPEVPTELFVAALVSRMRGRPSQLDDAAEFQQGDAAWQQVRALGFFTPEMRLKTLTALLGVPIASVESTETGRWASTEHWFSLGDGFFHDVVFVARERIDNGSIWGLRLRRRTVLPDSEIYARLVQEDPAWSLLDYEVDRAFSERRSLERWDWDETVHYDGPVVVVVAHRPHGSCEAVFDWGLLQSVAWQAS